MNLFRKPKIEYRPKPIKGDPAVSSDKRKEVTEPTSEQEFKFEIEQLRLAVDRALEIDALLDELRAEVDTALADYAVHVDPEKYPILTEAVLLLNDGKSAIINRQTLETAYDAVLNAYPDTYGIDPIQAFTSRIDAQGNRLWKTGNEDNGNTTEGFGLEPMDSKFEQKAKEQQFDLLKLLWRMLLAFFLRAIAKLLQKTKLHKVPIAGRMVKKVIKALNRAADRLEAWVRSGAAYAPEDIPDSNDYDALLTMEATKDYDSDSNPNYSSLNRTSAGQMVLNHTLKTSTFADRSESDNSTAVAVLSQMKKIELYNEMTKKEIQLTARFFNQNKDSELNEKLDQLKENSKKSSLYVKLYR